MPALNRTTAPKVLARVRSGKNASGRILTCEGLEPDFQRLLDYAETMQSPNNSVYRARLTSEVNTRMQRLKQERMDMALTAVGKATYDQGENIKAVGKKIDVLFTAAEDAQSSFSELRDGHHNIINAARKGAGHQQEGRQGKCMHGLYDGNSVQCSCLRGQSASPRKRTADGRCTRSARS